jgi:hypothetical protein
MNKIFRKATDKITEKLINRKFEKYGLLENPFPITPYVNQDSPEKKYNGNIYDDSIRQDEFEKIKTNYLNVPQSEADHLRLGFIVDKSFIGRGNGKSSFLLHLNKAINNDYCLDISSGVNKCFSIYFSPDGGGAIKSFDKFVDNFFQAICKKKIINEVLAILRYEAIEELNDWKDINVRDLEEEDIVEKLNDNQWIMQYTKSFRSIIAKQIFKKPLLNTLPANFPLSKELSGAKLSNQDSFIEYYSTLRKDKAKLEFVFDHLIVLFIAAGFNGAYVLVDDFEKIPDFQSSNQKKDFATQLRTVLFDGGYLNSKIGFFNFILALHAGVPRLMSEPWSLAGMEQRVPMSSTVDQKHIIDFGKLENKHAITLMKKYLSEFRKDGYKGKELYPFDEKSIVLLANNSEMNISKILKNSNQILELADNENVDAINNDYVNSFFAKKTESKELEAEEKIIKESEKVDLMKKIDQTNKK